MKKSFFFSLALFAPCLLTAQISSAYDEDMNAITVSAGLEKGKEVAGLSVDLGLSIKSRFQIEGSYVKTNFNTQDQYTYDGYIDGFSGTVSWWLFSKQVRKSSSFSLGLKGGVSSFDFKNYFYKINDITYEYDGYVVGRLGAEAMFSHWYNSQNIIMPSASVYYEYGKTSTISFFVNSKENRGGVTGKVGAYLMRKINYNDVVYLYPNLQFNYHELKAPVMLNLSFGMMVGY